MYGVTELTVLLTMDLPEGRDFVWIADCNTVVVNARLDDEGQQRAIDEGQAMWRRQWLRPVA